MVAARAHLDPPPPGGSRSRHAPKGALAVSAGLARPGPAARGMGHGGGIGAAWRVRGGGRWLAVGAEGRYACSFGSPIRIEVAMSRLIGPARLGLIVLVALAASGRSAGADEVIDGDTLVVEGQRMRLFGIDAFELQQTCLDQRGTPWRCGTAAKAALAELVQGEAIACTVMADTPEDDYIARCTGRNGIDLAGYLVEAGLALADRGVAADYAAIETAAAAAAAGAWSGTFNPPWEWRGHQQPR